MPQMTIVKIYPSAKEQDTLIMNNSKTELGEHYPPQAENTKLKNENCINNI